MEMLAIENGDGVKHEDAGNQATAPLESRSFSPLQEYSVWMTTCKKIEITIPYCRSDAT